MYRRRKKTSWGSGIPRFNLYYKKLRSFICTVRVFLPALVHTEKFMKNNTLLAMVASPDTREDISLHILLYFSLRTGMTYVIKHVLTLLKLNTTT